MNWKNNLYKLALLVFMLTALPTAVQAADYTFETTAPQNYYRSTSYEDVVGSQYNYGGKNVVDYQIPELEYDVQSTTMIGVMERTILPGLQQAVGTGGGYGVSGGGPITILTEANSTASAPPVAPTVPAVQQPAYTSVKGMERRDGSIGTVEIPSLGINMKVWEGETDASMKKGLGHYASTSAWDGNVGICGHNRGSKYAIGGIKNLEEEDVITYSTIYGTRTYAVTMVKIISNTDWSSLQATADNRLTPTTCLAGHPESRVVVQAIEARS